LWSNTAQVLKTWFRKLESTRTSIAFPSHRARQLSRNSVDYILQQAVNQAGLKCPNLIGKRISPRVVRHTTAMHLLQSGVDITLIALWLGHESIETIHVYIDADLATMQRALEKLAPTEAATFRSSLPIRARLPATALIIFRRVSSEFVAPARWPRSRSACMIQLRSISRDIPIFEAIERIAAPDVSYSCWCSNTLQIARSRTSSEYRVPVGFLVLFSFSILQISCHSQDPKSPKFPARFIRHTHPIPAQDGLTGGGRCHVTRSLRSVYVASA
jgi:hypothetical protein